MSYYKALFFILLRIIFDTLCPLCYTQIGDYMNCIFDNLPLPDKKIIDEYNCGDGAFMLIYDNCTLQDFEEYCKNIICKGFLLYDSNNIENNYHRTYTKNITLHTYFAQSEGKIRVIADPALPVYITSPISAKKAQTTLWQFEVDHSLIDCGMCYIVRCDDGSFFIIDSAHFYSVNDDIRLIEFLKKVSGEDVPRVSGWFLSHGHEDHIAKFTDILRYHKNELTIDCVYYNFPPLSHRDAPTWDTAFKSCMKALYNALEEHPEIRICKLHTGQYFCVKNLELDVLCTHEDVWPASFIDFNNSSTAIMMTAEGSKVLFPGDCSVESDKVLTGRYTTSLRCDIIQVSHHGHTGTSPEFYKRAGAQCALFPVTVIKYDEEWPRQESNRTAVDIADEFYIASNGTVEIDLPYIYGNVKEWPDETFEDFNGIFNLWTYEYTQERKTQLYNEYLKRAKKEQLS